MNLAFQANQRLKDEILSSKSTFILKSISISVYFYAAITMEKIFQLLTEHDDNLIMKTLGLLRNLICTEPHIDQLMHIYGFDVMHVIIMILEADYSNLIKEQALYILSNIAVGYYSKELIMGNDDLLEKINSFMVN